MSGEEDNFDIDIYGDGGGEDYHEEDAQAGDAGNQGAEPGDQIAQSAAPSETHQEAPKSETDSVRNGTPAGDSQHVGQAGTPSLQAPKQAPQTQGLKRKEGADDRPQDPGATAALFLSELHWWITDDDIRGWANQSGCEDELQEITFSEHKVNGKSKGQAYTLFASPQAATAVRRTIEAFGEGQVYKTKFSVTFSNPFLNPFKTLPKDGQNRNGGQMGRGGYSGPQSQPAYNSDRGGYRGGRGGYNSRGGMNSMGYNRGGYQQPAPTHPLPGSYQGGGYGGPMGGGPQPYGGGFPNRGGMMGGGGMRGNNMGMRGGRGGMNGMMGMPMGMGGMPGQMGMGMPQMNGGMGMQGFSNPGFGYPQQQDASWNPHGAKRTRQE